MAAFIRTLRTTTKWLFTPQRVSIALNDLPLLGARGEAVRAHVLECWWLSPVSVEFRGDKTLAFGLWLPRRSGQSHPGAGDGHNDTSHNKDLPDNLLRLLAAQSTLRTLHGSTSC